MTLSAPFIVESIHLEHISQHDSTFVTNQHSVMELIRTPRGPRRCWPVSRDNGMWFSAVVVPVPGGGLKSKLSPVDAQEASSVILGTSYPSISRY